MKIVSHDEFVKMPAGTVYTSWEPTIFGDICIKGDSLSDNDWWEQRVLSVGPDYICQSDALCALDDGKSVPLDLDIIGRDALYDSTRRFAVFEPDDVKALIARLQRCLP